MSGCDLTCRYELYGVVAHGGQLTSSGHYITYIRADHTASAQFGRLLMLACCKVVNVI